MDPRARLAIEALIEEAHSKRHRWDWLKTLTAVVVGLMVWGLLDAMGPSVTTSR